MKKIRLIVSTEEILPYSGNPDISFVLDIPFGTDTIKPKDKIRIKNLRGFFTYIRFATNERLDVDWIDCIEDASGVFRSFRPDQIKSVVRPKKPRKKKNA